MKKRCESRFICLPDYRPSRAPLGLQNLLEQDMSGLPSSLRAFWADLKRIVYAEGLCPDNPKWASLGILYNNDNEDGEKNLYNWHPYANKTSIYRQIRQFEADVKITKALLPAEVGRRWFKEHEDLPMLLLTDKSVDIPEQCVQLISRYTWSEGPGLKSLKKKDSKENLFTAEDVEKFEEYKKGTENLITKGSDALLYMPIVIQCGQDTRLFGGCVWCLGNNSINEDFFYNILQVQMHLRYRMSEIYSDYSDSLHRHQALKTAVAAIMARNMSHNIGSHVLAKVSVDTDSKGIDNRALFSFIQQRMDFIAQITTEFPTWSYSAWFLRNVMKGFYWQKHLFNNIALSDDLAAYNYDKPADNVKKIIVKIRKKVLGGSRESYQEITGLNDDFLLAIPGGTVGLHAFYVILENILRNAAKHSFAAAENKNRPFHITIDYEDNPDMDVVLLRVWDNYSNCRALPKEINGKLEKSIIDKNSRLKKENWGLAEIKISAGYLQMQGIDKIGGSGKDVLKIVSAGNMADAEGQGHLCYEFEIPRPKELFISGVKNPSKDVVKELHKHGVYVEEELPRAINEGLDADFGIIVDTGSSLFLQEIKKRKTLDCASEVVRALESLPGRLFVTSSDVGLISKLRSGLLKNRVAVLNIAQSKLLKEIVDGTCVTCSEDDIRKMKAEIYRQWLDFLASCRNIRPVLTVKLRQSSIDANPAKSAIKAHRGEIIVKLLEYQLDNREALGCEDVSKIIKAVGADFGDKDPLGSIELATGIPESAVADFIRPYEPAAPNTVPMYLREDSCAESRFDAGFEKYSAQYFPDSKNSEIRDWKIKYHRHGSVDSTQTELYDESLSGAATHFSLLASPPKPEEKLYFQLVENGLVRILIIDERMADFVGSHAVSSNKLNAANVYAVSEVVLSSKGSKDKKIKLAKHSSSEMMFRLEKRNGEYLFSLVLANNIVFNKTRGFDYVIVHQGVLDKIAEQWGISHEQFIDILRKEIAFAVVTTGRGEPANIPGNAKLLPFSSLESFLFRENHEKFLLVQTLMSLKRKGRVDKETR